MRSGGCVVALAAVLAACGGAGTSDDAGGVDGSGADLGTPDLGPDLGRPDAAACRDDADGDGHLSRACGGDDCDDGDANRYPGNPEVCDAVGHDEDCDPRTLGPDADGDGYTATRCCNAQPAGAVVCGGDCDDTRATINPSAIEACNGIDDDCNGLVDDAVRDQDWYPDCDGDRFGATGIGPVHDCAPPAAAPAACAGAPAATSWVPGNDTDCDDTRAGVNPAATEVCDGLDDDCNGVVDDGHGAEMRYYHDADADGYGVDGSSVLACTPPSGYAAFGGDCDDTAAAVNPGAIELCNGVDDDCDRIVDDGAAATCGLPNASAVCAAGVCAIGSCSGAFRDCNGTISDGCEVDLDTAVGSCGACGRACAGAAHASPMCSAAACVLACDPGFADCDAVAAGCETDTRSDTLNCGACAHGCSRVPNAIATCTAGVCGTRCLTGFADCDGLASNGCELDTRSDHDNCGACGRACLFNEACLSGACVAPFPSTGVDGDCVWNTSRVIAARVWNCRTVSIAAGATITTDGSAPLEIRSIGDVTIDGSIDLSGGAGGTPPAGSLYGGGGGTTGNPLGTGAGSASSCNPGGAGGDPLGAPGRPGGGTMCTAASGGVFGGGAGGGADGGRGGGAGGGGGWAGGGGGSGGSGGNGGAGGGIPGRTVGGAANGGGGEPSAGVYAGQAGCLFAAVYWNSSTGGGGSIGAEATADLPVATTFQPGSAGGGGGSSYNLGGTWYAGGGGGGGGGALRIASTTRIVVGMSGALRADGGSGGGSDLGGGGSGGVVYLSAPVIADRGTISAAGGTGSPYGNCFGGATGGAGGLGRIRLSVETGTSSCTLIGPMNPPIVATCAPTPGAGTPGRVYIAEYPN